MANCIWYLSVKIRSKTLLYMAATFQMIANWLLEKSLSFKLDDKEI
jgi:hypothetical protein